MRVLMTVSTMGVGGVARTLVDTSEELVRSGNEVTICSLYSYDSEQLQSDLVCQRSLGIERSRPVALVRGLLALRRLIREYEPDVVHSHAFHANILSRIACLGMPTSQVATLHSPAGRRGLHTFLARATHSLSNRTTAVSQDALDAYEARKAAPKAAVELIPQGIVPERYAFDVDARREVREELCLLPEDRLIVAVGRLVPAKDYAVLFAAFAKVAPVRADATLAIAGEGPLRASLEQLAEGLGIAHRVRFLGSYAHVPKLLSAADVFVLTSQWEGFGLVLCEAMASGLPVVTTAVGVAEAVVGDRGWVCDVGDSEGVAVALLAALDSSEEAGMREARAASQISFITAEYSASAAARGWSALYARISS